MYLWYWIKCFLPYVQLVLTGWFIFFNPGIRGRGGRGHDHTCQLRGRLRLNAHTYTHKSRTKHSHCPRWDPTQGLSDKSTDSGCFFFPASLFILKSVRTLEGGVIFHTWACDGSVKQRYTAVPLSQNSWRVSVVWPMGSVTVGFFLAMTSLGGFSWCKQFSLLLWRAFKKHFFFVCVCILTCHVFKLK